MPRQNGFFVSNKINTFKKYEIIPNFAAAQNSAVEKSGIIKQRISSKNFIKGQASFEYFVLFILLAFFCLLSISHVLPSASKSVDGIFEKAVGSITDYK